jgi:hypothetical protein
MTPELLVEGFVGWAISLVAMFCTGWWLGRRRGRSEATVSQIAPPLLASLNVVLTVTRVAGRRISELRQALRPFAEYARDLGDTVPDAAKLAHFPGIPVKPTDPTMGDCQKAMRAYDGQVDVRECVA